MNIVILLILVLSVAVFAIWYTYAGYPLILLLWQYLSSNGSPTFDRATDHSPSVSMVVPAHNEEAVIESKIQNIAEIEYDGQIEAVVVSDSTDETDSIVESASDSRTSLVSLDERRGKSAAINAGVEATRGDIIVFSDANTMYEPTAVQRLIAPLVADEVGCTTGSLRLIDEFGKTTESSYWKYELRLRRLESTLGTTVSTNGGVMAMKRESFERIPESVVNDDLFLTLREHLRGNRVLYVEGARATERTTGDVWSEYNRRVRIGTGNYQALRYFGGLLDPRRGVSAFEFVSHKLLRWLVPVLLAVAFVSNVLLVTLTQGPLVTLPLAAQISCYLFAVLGAVDDRFRQYRIFSVPSYFLLMNVALATGALRIITGEVDGIWQATR